MTASLAYFLLSEAGRELLVQADGLRAAQSETLTALTRLRKSAAPDQAAAAWEMSDLRRRALVKFGTEAAGMYFTRESLEQSSSRRAAAYHAQCFTDAGVSHIHDLCGGIGGDALAFARRGLSVTLYEIDPVRALFAEENARVCGLSSHVAVRREDVTGATLSPGAAWFDPARRDNSRRIASPDDYLPSLSFVRRLTSEAISPIGVKLSPAIEHSLAAEYDAALEFLSDGGECKEGLLWLGMPDKPHGHVYATLLTDGRTHTLAASLSDNPAASVSQMNSFGFLYEPDPAVVRAHLVGTLAVKLHAHALDPHIAYLIGDALTPTPFAVPYAILERFDYSRRRLQDALTRRDVGRVIIKKRGFPQEPDEVRRQLKLRGTQSIIVVLTRRGETHHALLVEPAGKIGASEEPPFL